MKKYLLIISFICFFFTAHIASAEISLAPVNKAVNVVDTTVYVTIDYTFNQAQLQAGKINIKYTIATDNTFKNVLFTSTDVIKFDGQNMARRTVTQFTYDKTKLTNKSTYRLKVDDSASSFEENFTTPDFYKKSSGTGDFYYTTSTDLGVYKTDLHKSFFRFTSGPDCKTAWQKSVDDEYTGYSVTYQRLRYSITDCFESGSIPTEQTFNEKLKPYGTFTSSVPFYYFTWRQSDGSWAGSYGYKRASECKNGEGIVGGKGIVIKCRKFDKPPMQPADWDNSSNSLESAESANLFDEDYTLLAPIGNLKKIDEKTKLGDYINLMLKIAIGLCGALAVIMIVINGIVWMGSESVFGHVEAKSRIMNSIGGLILALASYMLLNTINPDLVGGGGLSIKPVSIKLEDMVDKLPPSKDDKGGICNYANSKIDISSFNKSVVVQGGVLTQGIHECNAVDIGSNAAPGTVINVNAIADGTVMEAMNGCVEGNTSCGGGLGNYVKIKHTNGARTLYGHATKVVVKKGDSVKGGQKIMEMGNTGLSTARHLHIRVMYAKNPYETNVLRKPI